ncbi:MAG TPA: HEAT repeat domain-containing protein, partial [Thermoanaerobaculia bacterium]|nr:HEAT repeat domain-containing protein [Thermoanaerobaculia bacterium]
MIPRSLSRQAWPMVILLLAGCAARPRTASDLPVIAVPDLENRAILLLLSDQKRYDPLSVQQLLRGGPELRAELALTLGRIPGPQSLMSLEGLLVDDDPRVRRAAAFGLGVLKDKGGAPA